MSNDANAAALAEFNASTAPMSQVRESLNFANGQYDLEVVKLVAEIDDKQGTVYIQGEFKAIAGPGCSPGIAALAVAPVGNIHRERFFIGTEKDKLAQQPETRLNSAGFSRLKGIARVCQVPTNDQPVAQLCSSLLGKQFGNRVESRKYKAKDGSDKEAIGLGRNPTPIGTVPARLDSEAATPGLANGAAKAAVPAGTQFASE